MSLNSRVEIQDRTLASQHPPSVALLAEDNCIVVLPCFTKVVQKFYRVCNTALSSFGDVELPEFADHTGFQRSDVGATPLRKPWSVVDHSSSTCTRSRRERFRWGTGRGTWRDTCRST
mmetsp:Transcript_96335/g.166090  ORF Transcript_96335/g.166090 Transcript_96335/m.166090 type:complete len:118 (-) Transcript_96335:206-559(-)